MHSMRRKGKVREERRVAAAAAGVKGEGEERASLMRRGRRVQGKRRSANTSIHTRTQAWESLACLCVGCCLHRFVRQHQRLIVSLCFLPSPSFFDCLPPPPLTAPTAGRLTSVTKRQQQHPDAGDDGDDGDDDYDDEEEEMDGYKVPQVGGDVCTLITR